MKTNIKDFDKQTQVAIRGILRGAGWDGRCVNIYRDNGTVIFEHKEYGTQVKVELEDIK